MHLRLPTVGVDIIACGLPTALIVINCLYKRLLIGSLDLQRSTSVTTIRDTCFSRLCIQRTETIGLMGYTSVLSNSNSTLTLMCLTLRRR